MDQYELNYMVEQHRQWLNKKRYGRRADFTDRTLDRLDLSDVTLNDAIFVRSNVYSCDLTNTNLSNIVGTAAHFMASDFTNTNLKGAYLRQARFTLSRFSNTELWNVSGDGVYIISLQLGGVSLCYTSEALQINCKQYQLSELWKLTDADILNGMQGKEYSDIYKTRIIAWWNLWKDQIHHIVNNSPAKPVDIPK